MNAYKKIVIPILIALGLLMPDTLEAQQDPMYSQYMFNHLAINPAYAGSRQTRNINFITRYQWADVDGAPVTHTLTGHTPLGLMNDRLALGASIVQDKIGPETKTQGSLDLAYHLPVTKQLQLSFGLKAGVFANRNDLGKLRVEDNSDIYFGGTVGQVNPNVGGGLYLYSNTFYAGLSAPRLTEAIPSIGAFATYCTIPVVRIFTLMLRGLTKPEER